MDCSFYFRMWWLTLSLIWWCGIAAIPSPGPPPGLRPWQCPEITQQPVVECSCDMPHTLRCTGDKTALQIIGKALLDFHYTLQIFFWCIFKTGRSANFPSLRLEIGSRDKEHAKFN